MQHNSFFKSLYYRYGIIIYFYFITLHSNTYHFGFFRWVKEICGMKKTLEIFAGVKKQDVKGFRAPYLQSGGDVMFEAMAKCGLTYDTSLPAGELIQCLIAIVAHLFGLKVFIFSFDIFSSTVGENKPPMWPYTLDYKSQQLCKIKPCPTQSHPGMWEVPMVYYDDEQSPPRA